VLCVHPRGDTTWPRKDVFGAIGRPGRDPIGLHAVVIELLGEDAITVRNLEAITGIPVLDAYLWLGNRSGLLA
jgi:tRNA (Thr-GGU) A37 N-methylase